jgi:Cdc6-like AAA superfamily ATPase
MTTFTKPEANDQQDFTSKIVDAPTTNDLLGFTEFTVPVARRITSATNENTPMTIGIYGEWGSGKTSFLKMVEKELIANKISPIWFNAWKYDQEDNLWSALIQTILDQAQVSGKWYQRAWIKIKLWARQIRFKSGTWEFSKVLALTFVRIAIFLISAGIFLGWSVQDITDFLNQFSVNIFPNNPVITALIIKSAVAVVGIVVAKPESLLKLFEVKLGIDYSKLSQKQSYKEHIAFLDQFNNEFQHIIDRIGGGKPLVVIIDDLDRCLPEKAVQVLEAIKLFLDVKNCVFLLAVDREVVERAIAVKYKELIATTEKFNGSSSSLSTFLGENYFEKIIQLPFSLPPIARTDIENLITWLCPNDSAEEYSKIFAIGLPKNPRKVKRTLQIFLFLRDLAIDRIKKEEIRTSLLAKLVIIQNQFRPLYAEIVEMPELLSQMELFFREGKSTDPALQEKLEAFATDYLPLRDILLHAVDEQDSFVGVSVENYIFFVKTVTQASVTPREALSIEDENIVTRRYLRRVLESNRYFSRQGISSEPNQPLEAQIINPQLNNVVRPKNWTVRQVH